ncbi:hypothetical protein AB4Z22_45945, partial [Paenibacillus sp. TAF58]
LICMLFLLTDCWDRIEIDQRGFVVGVAIDYANASKHKFKGTYQIVVPSGLKQSSQGQSGSGSSGKAYFNLQLKVYLINRLPIMIPLIQELYKFWRKV